MKTFLLSIELLCIAFNTFSQPKNILLDYDAVDEIAATDSGGVYERFIWNLNTNYPDNGSVNGLSWAIVRFDTLVDADSLQGYMFDKPLRIDSILVFFTHENTTATPDTIRISIYRYEGVSGLQVNAQEQIINQVLFDTLIITTTSLTPTINTVDVLAIYPRLQLAAGERFLAGVHFYGDTANTFTLVAGYPDFCNALCAAAPSVFDSNSIYRYIYWEGGNRFTGINSISYDCDSDLVAGEADVCELFFIQNLAISAYLTYDTLPSAINEKTSLHIELSPNPAENFISLERINAPPSRFDLFITDMNGRRIHQSSFASLTQRLMLNVSHLPSGMYFLTLVGSHGLYTGKFVKK